MGAFRSTKPAGSGTSHVSGSRDSLSSARTSASGAPHMPRRGIVTQVVDDLAAGMTVVECAEKHRLPRDFVEQIVDHARKRGSLNMVALSAESGCSTGMCDPDPDSLVCAGCPLVPAASGRRATIRTLLCRKLNAHKARRINI
ncbi:hypothetical protein [Bifidobacterium magnum]|uniref:Uncharacterized protein n=1 Tax=Bifidobacterium magnum TaxID=1692 RepID=A0A087BCF6_9BIFI|nr:hypothetical protein [Bifidobacterium magnum]KFI68706.1 hypothetical protein BMAGN_0577 [Bifidobacterium magnum]